VSARTPASHPEPPSRPIRFFHRGVIVEVDGCSPTRSVLDWLREDARCTGTKEGCNEGDCGACTVIVGDLVELGDAQAGDGLRLRTVNACIQFMPTLHGRALFTVEDLRRIAGGTLHPVQQALVDCHASQCGFCTPGFAMSLAGCYERHSALGTRPTREALADEISGNLCRCTGYRPILDAGERMFDLPPARLDPAPVIQALLSLRAREGFLHAAAGARFHAPRSIEALAKLRWEHPKAVLLAGATDIGLWVNKQLRELPELIYVGQVSELQRIAPLDEGLRIGAGVSLEAAFAALTQMAPGLRELWLRFGSPPVRHAGTLGGNVANGSPVGDGAPALMALGASLVLRRGDAQRRLPLDDFYLGYQCNALAPGEFIEAIEVPRPGPASRLRAYKLSKRYDSDISAVCAALWFELDAHGAVARARFAYGGMAAIAKRARHAEAALIGRRFDEAGIRLAMDALQYDFTPISDLRASAACRMRVARNFLLRLWLQTRAESPLSQAQTSVRPLHGVGA